MKHTTYNFGKYIFTDEYLILQINVIDVDGNQYWPDDDFKFYGLKVYYKE